MGSASLCPNCRTPMVEVSGLLNWKSEDDGWDDLPEDDTAWDMPASLTDEAEKVWECPHCGHREYES